MSLHGSSSSSSFVDLTIRMKKTHPVSQLQTRGWVGSHPKEQTHNLPVTCKVVIVESSMRARWWWMKEER